MILRKIGSHQADFTKLHLPRKNCVNNAYIGFHKNLTDGLIAAFLFREALTDEQTWPTYESL